MSELSKQIIKTAQSDMCRNALNHWEEFKLPGPNEDIETWIVKLAKAAEKRSEGTEAAFESD